MRKLLLLIISITVSLIIISCGSTDSTTNYQISISASPSEGGSVSPSNGEYEEGTSLDISAIASEEYRFVKWQGDYEGTSSSVTITIDNSKNIQAIFAKKEYALTVNTEGEGTVDESILQTTSTTDYESGTIVELTANPAEGWKFVEWQGDISSNENPTQITVDEAKEVTAVFEKKSFAVNINTEGEGSVSKNPDQENYTFQSNLELEATPATGYEFVEWQGDIESTDNPVTVTVDKNPNFTAVFEKESYSFMVNTEGQGTVSEEPEETEYAYNSTVNLTANPDEGWKFVEWQGDISGTENPTQITIDKSKEVRAVFEEAFTNISGIISTNTILTSTDSPYQITGKIQLAYGATLEIKPGVKIYSKGQENDESNVIEVFGNLLIEGTNSEKVLIKNIEIQPGDNSTDELYSIEIHYANIIGGELYSPSGNSIYGSIILKNSFLYRVNRSDFIKTYMYIWYPQKDSYIENNIFYNSGRIDVGHRDANVYIRNNLFFRSEDFSDETGYAVENWASYNDSKTVLKYNTFTSSNGVAASLPSGYDSASLDATENYWNTTATDIIESMIFDKNDDLSVNQEIPFEPFLNSPDNNTPVLPDSLK